MNKNVNLRSLIGYLVLGVDYFEGDSAAHHKGEEGWDVDEWVIPFRTSAARITPPWIAAVKKQYGACRLFASSGYGEFSLSLSEIGGPSTKFFTVGELTRSPGVGVLRILREQGTASARPS